MNDKHVLTPIEPIALTKDKAAEALSLQPPTLDKDRREGHLGIPFVKAGRRILYQLTDLKDWLEDHRVQPKSKSNISTETRHGGDKK